MDDHARERHIRSEQRLAVLEMLVADLTALRFPDEAAMHTWAQGTDAQMLRKTADWSENHPDKYEPAHIKRVAFYEEAWTEMLALVLSHHRFHFPPDAPAEPNDHPQS